MGDTDQNAIAVCTLAWQTLRMAHHRVSTRLASELSHTCALAINEFDVLLYLRWHAREGVRISALLEAVPLSQPALSRLVARLEARGLLTRFVAESDGRASIVYLSDSGVKVVDRAIIVHAQVVHETLTSKLSDSERTALLQTLSVIGQ